ncbi:hypothetical protein CNMCM5623_009627 [Aspergillus felis]|uniref:Uncharacterized protein n=1 Tax=Aspergillus felis TaxID=1287682 RepID=A0A8H6PL05_9EURO|nr:hypothetical protein CNMCM5623_009627 [Aspergillus felis]
MWAYRFQKCLPESLKLGPATQKTKASKRIQAENGGLLQRRYDLLANIIEDTAGSASICDECRFQLGKGMARKVIGSQHTGDVCELEHSETMTAVECIAVDGWQKDPLFLFMSSTCQTSWFHGCEALSHHVR